MNYRDDTIRNLQDKNQREFCPKTKIYLLIKN